MEPFETFYNSPWQHPFLLWIAAAAGGFWGTRRQGLDSSVRRYVIALTVLSLADAWLTSRHVYGIGEWNGAASSAVPLFFVLAGDFRYLVLLGVATPDGSLRWSPRGVALGLGLTLIVPLISQLVVTLLPEELSSSRVLFLVYEVAFFVLTISLLRWHSQLRKNLWLRKVSFFVLVYYGLWATADAIILTTGSDLGFALRVVPNVLYYGGMIAVIAWAAANARSAGSPDRPG